MDIYNYWKKELNLDKKYKIKGFSRGSLRTGFMLLPCKIFLDAGVPCLIKPNAILITHGHQDHIDSLYNHLIDDDNTNTKNKVQVIATHNLINCMKDYLSACRSLNMGFKVKFYNWNPIPIISSLTLIINNTKFLINSYHLDHEVECIAYGISEIKKKLKKEFLEKNQEEIEILKKTIEICEEIEHPILLFCGDMNYTSLETLPFNNYPHIIIECTFIHEEHIQYAREKQHLHFNDLLPYFKKHLTTTFILIHFSCRYNKEELKLFILNNSFDNVIYWL